MLTARAMRVSKGPAFGGFQVRYMMIEALGSEAGSIAMPNMKLVPAPPLSVTTIVFEVTFFIASKQTRCTVPLSPLSA